MNAAAEHQCRLLIARLKELRLHSEQERIHFEKERNHLDDALCTMDAQLQVLHAQLKTGAGQEASSMGGAPSVMSSASAVGSSVTSSNLEALSSPSTCRINVQPEPPSSTPPDFQSKISCDSDMSDLDLNQDAQSEAEDHDGIRDEHEGHASEGNNYQLTPREGSFCVVSATISLPGFPDTSCSGDVETVESRKEHGSLIQFVKENEAQESVDQAAESSRRRITGDRFSLGVSRDRLRTSGASDKINRCSTATGGSARNSRSSSLAGLMVRRNSERYPGKNLDSARGSHCSLERLDHGKFASFERPDSPALSRRTSGILRASERHQSLPIPSSLRSSLRVSHLEVQSEDSDDGCQSDVLSWCLLPQWDQLTWKTARKMARMSVDAEAVASNGTGIIHSGPSERSLVDSVRSRSSARVNSTQIADLRDQSTWKRKWILQSWMMQPNSMKNLLWVCISMMLIIYDFITIPLLALDPNFSLFYALDWCTAVFWTLDIPKAFLTGVIDSEGQMDTRPLSVAMRYIRSNFLFDSICVIFHWLGVGFSQCNCSVGGVLQVLRFLRVWKLWRLSRSPEVEVIYMDYMPSEEVILFGQIALNIMELLLSGHIIACIWYGIAATHENDSNWVSSHQLDETSVISRYVWAVHWALAQFTGELVYSPENVKERSFTCVVLFITFIISCFFVSSITGAVTRLHIIASTQSKQMAQLRRYLEHHTISASLAVRIQHNAAHAISEQKRTVPESDVHLLSMISDPLRRELHFEMYSPCLISHLFFTCYHDFVSPECIQKVCHLAVSCQGLTATDVVFSNNELPVTPQMYFFSEGKLEYVQDGLPVQYLAHNAYLHASEGNLWTRWMHVGTLTAVMPSTILALDSEEFASILSIFPTSHAHTYAEGFVLLLNNSDKSKLSDFCLIGSESLKYEAFPEIQVRRSILSDRGSHRHSGRHNMMGFWHSTSQVFNEVQRIRSGSTATPRGSARSVRGSMNSGRGSWHSARASMNSLKSEEVTGRASMKSLKSVVSDYSEDIDDVPMASPPKASHKTRSG